MPPFSEAGVTLVAGPVLDSPAPWPRAEALSGSTDGARRRRPPRPGRHPVTWSRNDLRTRPRPRRWGSGSTRSWITPDCARRHPVNTTFLPRRISTSSTQRASRATGDQRLTRSTSGLGPRAVHEGWPSPTSRTGSETGVIEDPRALMRNFGEMGLLGMHLEGYGCAGLSAVDYGLAYLELGRATRRRWSRSRARWR